MATAATVTTMATHEMRRFTSQTFSLTLGDEYARAVLEEGSKTRRAFEIALSNAAAPLGATDRIVLGEGHRAILDVTDAQGRRRLQMPGVQVNIQYTIECGDNCGDTSSAMEAMSDPNDDAGQVQALSFATSVVEAVTATAVAIDPIFAESIMTVPESIAASIEPPAIVAIPLPGIYIPAVNCLGSWSQCQADCEPRL